MSEEENYQIIVPEGTGKVRVDKFLAQSLPDVSRSRVQQLILEGCVEKNAQVLADCSGNVKQDDVFDIFIPPAESTELLPADIPLDIVFEDEHMLVINKQSGLTVHPGAGNYQDTLVNALLGYCADSLSGIGGVARPGIVHRLDKDTSGLMVVAKSDKAHNGLAKQLETRELKRVYRAFIWEMINPFSGNINANIGRSNKNRKKMAVVENGKTAVTHYKTLAVYGDIASQLECRLETGRTHQIRVHLTHRGHSIIGDDSYGGSHSKLLKNIDNSVADAIGKMKRQALHAKQIGFFHPITKEYMEFDSELPEDIAELEKSLNLLRRTTK